MDLIKLVPLRIYGDNLTLDPYYVSTDIWKDNPLACVRFLQVAKAWEVRIYGHSQHTGAEHFATLHIEYDDDDHEALLSAYSTFNSIHEVVSATQLRNAGFTIS